METGEPTIFEVGVSDALMGGAQLHRSALGIQTDVPYIQFLFDSPEQFVAKESLVVHFDDARPLPGAASDPWWLPWRPPHRVEK
jgi:hypothetical protein